MKRENILWGAERLLRWLVGAWLFHLSVRLAMHSPDRLLVGLGLIEAAAAALFLFRKTARAGGLLLLLVFAFAAGFHLRAAEQATPLLGLAVVVAGLTLLAGRRVPGEAPVLSDEDRAFLRAFETTRLSPADFHHRDHIRAAWAMLCSYPPSEALARFTSALKRLAARAGKPERYHETITWAYLLLVHERLTGEARALPFGEFAAKNPDLLTWGPSILDEYYRPEVLSSERARQVFVLPQGTNRRNANTSAPQG
jgi:hypothetical protein